MVEVAPVLDERAATVPHPDGTALVVADYHAGVEATLRREGVEAASRTERRRERLLDLVAETGADRVVFLGDVGDSIGEPGRAEREELEALADALSVPATLVPGNHDGGPARVLGDLVDVVDSAGVRRGDVGFAHGHTWPAPAVLGADVLCVGHEHPTVRIEDPVGGRRVEPAWLRGPLDPAPFDAHHGEPLGTDAELVVFPAFNELVGGTWVNVPGQEFLAPFLPEGLPAGEAFLLDGTNLGDYRSV
ncbi:MAG: metallophosphoesterase [Halobacteriaceae archaeon]